MNALRLKCEISHDGIFLRVFVLCAEIGFLDFGYFTADIRKDEEFRVRKCTAEKVMAVIGHFYSMLLLVYHEKERIGHYRHLPFIVLDIIVFRPLQELFHARLAEELDKRLVFWKSLIGSEKQFPSFFLVTCRNKLLRFIQSVGNQSSLVVVQLLDIRFVLHELLVITFRYRAGNDQRSTGVVDKHGIDLIDDGIVMLALHEVLLGNRHIVPQIIEAEFIVGSESDIACVCFPA